MDFSAVDSEEALGERGRPAELGEWRRSIIAGDCPVLLDADEVATVLDITERQARERFANCIVAGDTNRHLIRAVEFRAELLAMRAPYRPAPVVTVTTCKSCGGPLPIGARRGTRFCGKRCADMTLERQIRRFSRFPGLSPAGALPLI